MGTRCFMTLASWENRNTADKTNLSAIFFNQFRSRLESSPVSGIYAVYLINYHACDVQPSSLHGPSPPTCAWVARIILPEIMHLQLADH